MDIHNGDEVNKEYRSRVVGQEFARDKREDLFAATPPLEAKKALMSMAVTEGIGYRSGHRELGMCIDYIDVSRAFFHADALREVYVKLPEEDHEEGMCGLLGKSLYGTRDAAQNWEVAYTEFVKSIEFETGKASPCTFHQKEMDIRALVHGGDFAMLGSRKALDWFRKRIEEKFATKYEGRM